MRAGVGAHIEVGEIARAVVAKGFGKARLERGVAGPMDHPVFQGHTNINPAHGQRLNANWFSLNLHHSTKLLQPAFFQVIFIKTKVVAEFVEVRGADFVEVHGLVVLGDLPEVFEEENNLRGLRMTAGRVGH